MCSIIQFIKHSSVYFFWFVFGMFHAFLFSLKKMYNCIIIFISFILYRLEKDLKAFLVLQL